jgi:hypothetical protein
MAEQQDLVAELAAIRRGAIAEARQNGMKLEEIDSRLGVSPGRVSPSIRTIPPAPHIPSLVAGRHSACSWWRDQSWLAGDPLCVCVWGGVPMGTAGAPAPRTALAPSTSR